MNQLAFAEFESGLLAYAVGAGAYLVLTVLLLTAWRGGARGGLLVVTTGVSVIWCGLSAFHAGYVGTTFGTVSFRVLEVLEILRDAAWFAFLLNVLGHASGRRAGVRRHVRIFGAFFAVVCVALVLFISLYPLLDERLLGLRASARIVILGHILLAIGALALLEQLIRSTRPEHRWAMKFLYVAVGGLFVYDFYLYSDAMLFRHLDVDLWGARGFINALVVPLIAVSAARNPQWSLEIFVSRQVVFHTAAILGAGAYLLLMAGAGYYIRLYGGVWGPVVQTAFLFAAAVLLLVVILSDQIRSRFKVFLTKHFFRNAYEYREEWLRFTHTLSTSGDDTELRENIVRAIADIVQSEGGIMWVRTGNGTFAPVSAWQMRPPANGQERDDSRFVRFFERTGWVVFLDEYHAEPGRYEGLELPAWMRRVHNPWLVAPMFQRDELLGFIVLARSRSKTDLGWEDSDLLKTVGRQAASYIALLKATDALAEARQFEAFNRLSAYVVHDLKNLVAQLSLVASNAKHHMHNPDFIADAVNTIDNAKAKMNRMLANLRKGRLEQTTTKLVNLRPILRKVVKARAAYAPAPVLERADQGLFVAADPERLATVMEHLIGNAQEATPPDGRVAIRALRAGTLVEIRIEDTGCGMDEDFVAHRLFRPFDTTKGNAGMGIGAYESREFIRSRGGDIEVQSEPGKGTVFTVRLPLDAGAGTSLDERTQVEVAS